MNLFTRTFSKIFKSSNQQELDNIQNIIEAINNKGREQAVIDIIHSDLESGHTTTYRNKSYNIGGHVGSKILSVDRDFPNAA